jgi:hypothetical protein
MQKLTRVGETRLSKLAANRLAEAGISSLGQLLEKSEANLLRIKGLGRKSINEIREALFIIDMGLVPDAPLPPKPPKPTALRKGKAGLTASQRNNMDAARYRQLRDHMPAGQVASIFEIENPEEIDRMIDFEIRRARPAV